MRIDCHVHTKHSPDCAMEPALVLKLAKKRDLDGVCVVDHGTIRGGLAAKKLNRDRDFKIFTGCEVKTPFGEIGAYDIDSEIRARQPFEVVEEIHDLGGLAWIPHPFDKIRREVLKRDWLYKLARRVDLIEGENGRTFFAFNRQAAEFAKQIRKPIVGGSDSHLPFEIGRVFTQTERIKKGGLAENNTFPAQFFFCGARTKVYKLFGV